MSRSAKSVAEVDVLYLYMLLLLQSHTSSLRNYRITVNMNWLLIDKPVQFCVFVLKF